MQKLIESRLEETLGGRAVRAAACVSVCAAAVFAAGMVQVRPALAGERAAQVAAAAAPTMDQESGTRLLSGDHARAQLQQARRALMKAEGEATNDEDRRKISTARGIAAAAESTLAEMDRSSHDASPAVDLSRLQLQLSNLKVQTDFLNSPEWKADMEKQRAYFDSPEWKARMEQQQQALEKARVELNSPEFKARIEAASRVDPDKIRVIVLNAQRQQQRAMAQIRSGVIQRQVEQANQFVARNESPVLPVETLGDAADQPVKVSPGVMSANATHKEPPIYPAEAKEKRIQGAVVLHAIISEQGKVEQLSVISSPDEMLSKSALDAVHQWTYKPYLLNGQPTAVDTKIEVNYSLTK